MESEQGKFAKFGAVQNKKLLREVTTISRMTHKNIVRYFQAWVEGGSAETTTDNPSIPDNDDDGVDVMDTGDALATEDGEDSDDDNDASGWWASSPPDRDLPKEMQSSSSSSSSDGDSTSWSDTDGEDPSWSSSNSGRPPDNSAKYRRNDSSLSNLLAHENDHAFDVSIVVPAIFKCALAGHVLLCYRINSKTESVDAGF